MARQPRVSYAGAMYHVTSRGNNGGEIFLDYADFERFHSLLGRYRERHDFRLYAYALIPNHVHLLIETTESSSISQIMHGINTAYAMYFNGRHNRSGHVFQGRFRSSIIDSENYFLEVMRYIDLNAVRAGLAKDPSRYRWSSCRHWAGGEADELLDGHELYECLGETAQERRHAYRGLLRDRLEGGSERPQPELSYSVFMGGEDFESRMTRIYGRSIWVRYRRLLDELHELRRAALPE